MWRRFNVRIPLGDEKTFRLAYDHYSRFGGIHVIWDEYDYEAGEYCLTVNVRNDKLYLYDHMIKMFIEQFDGNWIDSNEEIEA